MDTFPEYGGSPGCCEIDSGGVKAGVPTVDVKNASFPSNSLLTPRSAIFTYKKRRVCQFFSYWRICDAPKHYIISTKSGDVIDRFIPEKLMLKE